MDFKKFCQDLHIKTAPRGHKHNRSGWVNISCPLCSGDFGFHLGYNYKQGYFSCYRCGWHSDQEVVSVVANVKGASLKALLIKYKGKPAEEKHIIIRPGEVCLPSGSSSMSIRHRQYLSKRKFNPTYLEEKWGLKGTDHLGNYKFRIIAPIYFQHQLVSYQGRDITDRQQEKYKAAAEDQEMVSHKHILYGWDELPDGITSCLVVEGITGVWRFGPGTLGTFGVEYTPSQVRLLSERFIKVYIFFDPDEAGQIATNRLMRDLSVMGQETIALSFENNNFDSGDTPQNIADAMIDKIRQGIL